MLCFNTEITQWQKWCGCCKRTSTASALTLLKASMFCCNMSHLAVVQGDPADSVFFIEDGDCQVGYNQRRTADEDLISAVSTLDFCCCVHGQVRKNAWLMMKQRNVTRSTFPCSCLLWQLTTAEWSAFSSLCVQILRCYEGASNGMSCTCLHNKSQVMISVSNALMNRKGSRGHIQRRAPCQAMLLRA